MVFSSTSYYTSAMPRKIQAAKITLLVMGYLQIVIAVGFLVLLIYGTRAASTLGPNEVSALGPITVWSWFIMLPFAALATLNFIAAAGLKKQSRGSKMLAIVSGALSLPSFPIGTLLGLIVLVCVVSDEGDEWFVKR